jgi:molecular chaperone GrpE
MLGKFLPVLDNLQRAMAFDDGDGLRGGLNATLKGFESLLASEGIVAVETLGKPFDPHLAEAIATRETADHEDDVVIEEAQRGYRLGDDLLRPAMVVVAKKVNAQ